MVKATLIAPMFLRRAFAGWRFPAAGWIRLTALAAGCAAGILTMSPLLAEQVLEHRWSFGEESGATVLDSVGGAHGEVKGAGSTRSAGKLTLPGGSSASAAYVDLPNGILSSLTDVSFEGWVSVNGSRTWSRIFDFGVSGGQELTGPGGSGDGTDYFMLTAQVGNDINRQQVELRDGGNAWVSANNVSTTLGQEFHFVVTYDADGNGGSPIIRFYRQGNLVTTLPAGAQLAAIDDRNNWLGRSNWTNDANLSGTFNEFRIYSSVLDAQDVADNLASGPDVVNANGPVINHFTATPDQIFEGETATLAWDIDPGGGPLSLAIAPAVGDLSGKAAADSITLTPATTTTYTLTATTPDGERTRQATVTVDPGVPVAEDSSVTTDEGVPVGLTLQASDPNMGALSYTIVTAPAHGTLSGTAPSLTYTPAPGYSGPDSLTFRASDGSNNSNLATVSIEVYPAPAPPTGITINTTTIPTTTAPGDFVATLTSADINPQNTHSYALVPGSGDADNPLFGIESNVLVAAHDFGADAGRVISIRVRTTDDTGRSFERSLLLSVVSASHQVSINEIHYNPPENTMPLEFVELYNPDPSAPVDLAGWSFSDGVAFVFPAGASIPPGGYLVVAEDPAALQDAFGSSALGPWTGGLNSDGERIRLSDAAGTVIDQVDYKPGFPWPVSVNGEGGSMELIHPSLDNDLGSSWRSTFMVTPGLGGLTVTNGPLATPGAQNFRYSETAAPNIRQVKHFPVNPPSGTPTTITAKVTDPQGVGSVTLQYQVVEPGAFIPSRFPLSASELLSDPDQLPPENPAFENPANWSSFPMTDDGTGGDTIAGDDIFTATLPGQPNRTLVRYRVTVADLVAPPATARVPYPDDFALNFAYFVYDGVPDYVASTRSVHPAGAGHAWPTSLLTALPVYHLVIRDEDMDSLMAYGGGDQLPNDDNPNTLAARRAYNWEAAFVYDGVVYDHMHARLRGGNSRYQGTGKRHYKFRFNRGSYFQARDQDGDPYPTKWRVFNTSRMFGNRGGAAWGMPELVGAKLWQLVGIPAQSQHWFHFRVVDGADEAPDQYGGDFWGLSLAQERYDVRFLDARDMAKGNLYKLSDWLFDGKSQQRYQAADAVSDAADYDDIHLNVHGGQAEQWLKSRIDYDKWYHYSAVLEAIRHYDMFPEPFGRHRMKNLVFYFEPDATNPNGKCWFLPYDWDASFGPNFNNGWDQAHNAIYNRVRIGSATPLIKPQMIIEHRNVLRSFRDLVWQPDQLEPLIDDYAAVIAAFSEADRDRWRLAPASEGTQNDSPLAAKVQDMKNFAFVGGSWDGGNEPADPNSRDSGVSGQQGRDAYLDAFARDNAIPGTPSLTYTGAPNYPTDSLAFQSSAFADPQGAGTFGAMEWRVAEITDPTAPGFDPAEPRHFEWSAAYQSGELTPYDAHIAIPGTATRVGRTYRARVRFKDNSGRWSHWSTPHQFTASEPAILPALVDHLIISEFMYHPTDTTPAEAAAGYIEDDFEFIEVYNNSPTLTLDLTDVRFTKGVDYDFADGSITSLAPRGIALVVRHLAAFESRYGTGHPVAGQWESGDSLKNSSERLKLSHGAGTPIRDFVYSDSPPWPTAPDGDGFSLVFREPDAIPVPDHADPASWRASSEIGGSPGRAGSGNAFGTWMAANGFTDPHADPDHDGLTHFLTFALAADLIGSGAPLDALPRATTVEVGGASYLALAFRRRQTTDPLEYQVECCIDLGVWQSDPGDGSLTVEMATTDNGDGSETAVIRMADPITESPTKFVRLKVSEPAP
ncbi:hypothetical protein BH23VER1_BH23VER1_19110 [soil metagenome]